MEAAEETKQRTVCIFFNLNLLCTVPQNRFHHISPPIFTSGGAFCDITFTSFEIFTLSRFLDHINRVISIYVQWANTSWKNTQPCFFFCASVSYSFCSPFTSSRWFHGLHNSIMTYLFILPPLPTLRAALFSLLFIIPPFESTIANGAQRSAVPAIKWPEFGPTLLCSSIVLFAAS